MSIKNTEIASAKDKALALLKNNQLSEARDLYANICEGQAGDDPEAWYMLGTVNGMLGLIDEAGNCFRKAIAIRPDFADAHRNLGNVYSQQNRPNEALECYQKGLRLNPDDAGAYINLGNLLQNMGRIDDAAASFREALRLNPDFAIAYYNLGNLHMVQGNLDESRECYERALQLDPGSIEIRNNLGNVLKYLGWVDEALECYRQVLRLNPNHLGAFYNMGLALELRGQFDEALECYRQVLRLNPGHVPAIAGEASALARQGKFEAAYERLRPCLETGVEDSAAVAITLASFCRHVNQCKAAIAMMERLLGQDEHAIGRFDRINLHFSLGKLYDAAGEFKDAFDHYRRGNTLKASSFDCNEHIRYVDDLIDTYSSAFMDRAPRSSIASQRPVFIVGMPRSGSSLVEQILASHPQVYGAGELQDIGRMTMALPSLLTTDRPYPQCMSAMTQDLCDTLAQRYLDRLSKLDVGAARVTDKMPRNFLHLGLIALLFPGARIIHCIRNPLDTCVSCYFQNFGGGSNFADDLSNLGAYYLQYQRLMRHWGDTLGLPVMTIHYEEMVADQERMSRALVEFCGLEWDENCLRFFESKRAVATASYDQVRQPMYNKSVQRWRHYEAYLGPLKKALAID